MLSAGFQGGVSSFFGFLRFYTGEEGGLLLGFFGAGRDLRVWEGLEWDLEDDLADFGAILVI